MDALDLTLPLSNLVLKAKEGVLLAIGKASFSDLFTVFVSLIIL